MADVDVTIADRRSRYANDRLRGLALGLGAGALLAIGTISSCVANAQLSVTTQHNDIGRTGQNLNETTLTPANVNPTQFGKLFSQPVDGQVYAQPLYLQGITVNGTSHNVVFVATENDSVYAFDADTNGGTNSAPLWRAALLSTAHGAAAGAVPVTANQVGTNDISPTLGITGTPVIDPGTGTLYVVSESFENGTALHRLHALDVSSGAEKFGGPVVITATVPGTGTGSVGGSVTFNPLWQNQRAGLLLLNGIVYVAFASNADNGPWHGWILGYNAATLQQVGIFCGSPNGSGSGVWMSGNGLTADQLDPVNHPYGRMFVPDGNGDFTASPPYNSSMDFGESILNLDLTNGVPTVTDQFTTNQWAALNAEDLDVGSGGLLVLPTQTTGIYPHLAVQTGKTGNVYLLNRDNLGGYNATTDQVLQVLPAAVGVNGAWSSPAYFNGTIYYWGRNDYLKAFQLVNGLLSSTPSQSLEQMGYPGATPSISANGNTQGLVWTIDSEYNGTAPAVLEARDATNVVTPLYSSATNPTRDQAGIAVKMSVPTIVNGKVYVGAQNEVDVYGLLSGSTQTPAPTFSPGSESFTGTINVSILDANPNATIYYTTNGAPATVNSTKYSGAIAVGSTRTINAIASATGQDQSTQASATYVSNSQTLAVAFSLPTGTYGALQVVSLTDPTPNAVIYYTTDGSTPITSGTTQTYSAPITVNATETIIAVAVAPGLTASPAARATYTIQEGVTGINFPQGFASSAGLIIQNGSTGLDDSRLQLTNGLANETGSAWFYTPVDIQTFTSIFSYQLSNPAGSGITFAIQNSPATVKALGGSGQQLGYAPISNSVAVKFDLINNATGLYTSGAVPLAPATSLSGTPINLYSGDAMTVTLTYNGTYLAMTIQDLVTTKSWSTGWTINIPAMIGGTSAYVGFTGSTSTQTASQKILSWSYVNNYAKPFGLIERATAGATGATAPAAGDELFVSGWIADPTDGSPLSNVTVYLDGVSIGKPTLGVSRPDVATAQNNAAYGNSGFTLLSPTTLSAGAHAVTVVGIDSHGVSNTLGPLAVTVITGSFGSLDKAVDSANGGTAIATWDNLVVSGWIADPVDGSPMSNVQVLIDGVSVGTPTLGIARPDIATGYGDPAFANSGFLFTYPGNSLAVGPHLVTVVGVNSRSVSTTLGPLAITTGPPIGNLERAIDSTTHSSTVPATDTLFISGWMADPVDGAPVGNVTVFIDGASIGTPTMGISRADVVAAQNNGRYLHSGYQIYYPASSLSGGTHAATVVGINSHSVSSTFGPLNFVVDRPIGVVEKAVDASTDDFTGTPEITATGLLNMSGWVADPVDGSPLSNVKVLIDGIAVGTPTLGISRPDIAKKYNNSAYGTSGFSFFYGVASLAAGAHQVTVVAVNAAGASTTLAPLTIYVAPPFGNLEKVIDATTGSSTVSVADNIFLSGWMADPTDGTPMSNVKVLIDGVAVGTPTLGLTRNDIALAYDNPAYSHAGFSFTYPASALSAGTHQVTLYGVDSLGMTVTLVARTITVTVPASSPVGNLEKAIDPTTGSTTIPSTDNLYASGWIADPNDGSPMTNVIVLIDGVSVGAPTLGIARPDVATAKNNPAYGLSGFSLLYPASTLTAGAHSVTVVGVDSHGLSTTLGPKTIAVTVAAGGPLGSLDMAIDATTRSTMISGNDNLFVSGWIADPVDGSPLGNVTVLIDGVVVGTPILGITRNDVATAKNNPAYANSGYNFVYAGSGLTPGPHAVTVVGVDSRGLSKTLGPLTITH